MYSSDPIYSPDLAGFFQALGQPARLQILTALGEGEACVCHLEALCGQRQSYISQQLGVLRRANLVNQRRDGKHVYYSLASDEITRIVQSAAALTGLAVPTVPASIALPVAGCTCPACLSAEAALQPVQPTSRPAVLS